MFIDATYEGDLMAKAGVEYHVGREANSVYNETLNGVQVKNAVSHQFTKPVSAYKEPGNPRAASCRRDRRQTAARWLGRQTRPGIQLSTLPNAGREQPTAVPKPEGYDPLRYELFCVTCKPVAATACN